VSRLRLLLLVTGLGALMSGGPVFAVVAPDGDGITRVQQSGRAMTLLESAARTARTSSWSGTQHVVSTRSGEPRFTVLQIQHTPGTGSTIRVLTSEDEAVAADSLDQNLLLVLARHYDLRILADSMCSGRRVHVVEALRPGLTGPSAIAGRFWVDQATGLLLRRDVLDEEGEIVRTSSFVSLAITPLPSAPIPAAYVNRGVLRPSGRHLDDGQLQVLEAKGWPVASALPSGLELFEARLHDGDSGDVLQLSYSDGLSTLSLFIQNGVLPGGHHVVPGTARPMAGSTVWVSPGAAEQVVWSGGGRTWTLVSDAPQATIVQAVTVLPHTKAAAVDDGVVSRAWRGMSRVGSWLNPFE
jgi:negative regulator of sigma E activity